MLDRASCCAEPSWAGLSVLGCGIQEAPSAAPGLGLPKEFTTRWERGEGNIAGAPGSTRRKYTHVHVVKLTHISKELSRKAPEPAC